MHMGVEIGAAFRVGIEREIDSLALTCGAATAVRNQSISCAVTSFGVLAGATTPNQTSVSKPGKPDSATVGKSGSGSICCAAMVAKARALPAVICWPISDQLSTAAVM